MQHNKQNNTRRKNPVYRTDEAVEILAHIIGMISDYLVSETLP